MGGKNYPDWRIEEQCVQVLRMRMAGAGYKAIATELKLGVGTVYSRLDQAYDRMRPHADFNKYRARQLAEMDEMRRQLGRQIVGMSQSDPSVGQRAIDLLIKLQAHEAKLLGLERVPTPFDELSGLSDEKLEEIVRQFAAELNPPK
jgi:hypothetical protein